MSCQSSVAYEFFRRTLFVELFIKEGSLQVFSRVQVNATENVITELLMSCTVLR